MDSGNKKTCKTSMTITKKGTQKPKSKKDAISLQQTNDADAELALALSRSEATVSAFVENDDFEHQQHLLHLKHQEEADAEYARQLAEEFEVPSEQASASTNPVSRNRDMDGDMDRDMDRDMNRDRDRERDVGDDMDAVLEEIARMEAQERLKASGHAYNAKTNINRILADEDVEEARIREKVKREAELREWRKERERQDAAFAAAAEHDRLQELSKKVIETSIHEPVPVLAPVPAPAPTSILQEEPAPLTKDELRTARIAFFTTRNLQKS